MAQTIAMQRGTGTLSASGNTSATLFLQSGGTATRVICNGIAWYSNSGYSFMHLFVVPSGGAPYIVGRFFQYASDGQFVAAPNGGLVVVGGGSGAFDGVIQMYRNGNNYIANADPSSVTTNAGGQASMPQNFWIGPGDEVKLRANNGGAAQTFGYSFTTITES
jgi:hypothetical protein